MDDFEVFASIVARVGGAEVYYRGYDSGIMRFNVFENGVKKIYYVKLGGELTINGYVWVCTEFSTPTNGLPSVGSKVARFVKKEIR